MSAAPEKPATTPIPVQLSASEFNQCTGGEFYVAQQLLALANVEGHRDLPERCGQNNGWDSVAERGTGMRVIAAFFDPCAPAALTAHIAVFSHDFTRFDRLAAFATRACFSLLQTPLY